MIELVLGWTAAIAILFTFIWQSSNPTKQLLFHWTNFVGSVILSVFGYWHDLYFTSFLSAGFALGSLVYLLKHHAFRGSSVGRAAAC